MIEKIKIEPAWMTPVTPGIVNVMAPFDGDSNTFFFAGWKPENYPARIQVDFPQPFDLDRFRIYDGSGQPVFSASLVTDDNRMHSVQMNLTRYNDWLELPLNLKKVVKVIFTLNEPQGERPVGEIEIYGQPASGVVDPPPPPPPPPPPVDTDRYAGLARGLGTNGFDWCSDEALSPFGCVRLYGFLKWTWQPDGIAVSPAYRDVDYDIWLAQRRAAGQEVVWCMNGLPGWFAGQADETAKDLRWHLPGADPEKPESYQAIAQYYFQIAARYGRVKHPESVLRVCETPQYPNAPVTSKKSGLNLLDFIEIENEPNRWWKHQHEQYTPAQFAALLSACYDGHMGTLGPGCGIKAADPSMGVAFGLADINIEYLQGMQQWFEEHRSADSPWPYDVVGVHHYCSSANSDAPRINFDLKSGYGCSPERDRLHERLMKLVNWVFNLKARRWATSDYDLHNDDIKIWLSEIGWDTDPSSPLKAEDHYPAHSALDSLVRQAIQAKFLQRAVLLALAAGVDRVMVFNAIDEPNPAGGLFQSSGVSTGQAEGQQPKEAFLALDGLRRFLKGTDEIEIDLDPLLYKASVWTPSGVERRSAFWRDGESLCIASKPQLYQI